ncbi:hypothetical protein KO495_07310 [Colwellia sp. D2M02]|nr:hypothetical protein [Colwellia sp. D2M02]
MEHSFYLFSRRQKIMFYLKLVSLFILINVFIGALLFFCGLSGFSLLFLAISLTVFAPFVDVPSGMKNGSLLYYSPLLIAEKMKNNQLVLHSGSLFDYYFALDFTSTAQERKRRVFIANIKGLLALIAQYEQQNSTNIRIKVTSYIINPRTANKLGLQRQKTDFIQLFILYFNFVNLTCAMSLLKGKFTLPNLKQVYTFEGELDVLIANKAYLQGLQKRLLKTA